MSTTINFQSNKHHTQYRNKAGKRLPSVTTVLDLLSKPALIKWANTLGINGVSYDSYMSTVAGIGTCLHMRVEADLLGVTPDLSEFSPKQIEYADNCMLKYYDWRAKHEIKNVQCEIVMVSEDLQTGGTADIIAEVDGIWTILDIKSSDTVYPEHCTQLATYKMIAVENGFPVEQCIILRFGKDETLDFDDHQVMNVSIHQDLFKKLREIYAIKALLRKDFE